MFFILGKKYKKGIPPEQKVSFNWLCWGFLVGAYVSPIADVLPVAVNHPVFHMFQQPS